MIWNDGWGLIGIGIAGAALLLSILAVIDYFKKGKREARQERKEQAEAAQRIKEAKANAPRTFQEMVERWMKGKDR